MPGLAQPEHTSTNIATPAKPASPHRTKERDASPLHAKPYLPDLAQPFLAETDLTFPVRTCVTTQGHAAPHLALPRRSIPEHAEPALPYNAEPYHTTPSRALPQQAATGLAIPATPQHTQTQLAQPCIASPAIPSIITPLQTPTYLTPRCLPYLTIAHPAFLFFFAGAKVFFARSISAKTFDNSRSIR
jgi:hypothetical protein